MNFFKLFSKTLCLSFVCSTAFAEGTYPPTSRSLDLTIKNAPADTVCTVANARGKVKVSHGRRIRVKITGYPGFADISCKMPDGQSITLLTNKFLFKRSTHNLVTEGDVASVKYSLSFPTGYGTARTVTRFGTFKILVAEDAIRNYRLGQSR